jgi:hypothetical protein
MAFPVIPGAATNLLNISAPVVVKAAAGSIVTVTVTGAPTAGNLVLNDCATTGAAAAENQIIAIPFGGFTGSPSSAVIPFGGFVTTTGIVISAVPTGATVGIAFA